MSGLNVIADCIIRVYLLVLLIILSFYYIHSINYCICEV